MYPKWDGNTLQSSLGWEVEPDCSWNLTSIQDARSNTKATKSVRTRYHFGPKSSVAATLTTLSEASYRARVRQALDELPTIVLLYVCNVRYTVYRRAWACSGRQVTFSASRSHDERPGTTNTHGRYFQVPFPQHLAGHACITSFRCVGGYLCVPPSTRVYPHRIHSLLVGYVPSTCIMFHVPCTCIH
jgi:hypothetical protein